MKRGEADLVIATGNISRLTKATFAKILAYKEFTSGKSPKFLQLTNNMKRLDSVLRLGIL